MSGALYVGGTGVLASPCKTMVYCKRSPFLLEQQQSTAQHSRACLPDVADLRPVLQEPAVGCFILPAHISRILPQQPHLGCCVPRVPQRVSEMFPRTCRGLDSLPRSGEETIRALSGRAGGNYEWWGIGKVLASRVQVKALGWTTVGSGARSLCKCWKYRDTLGDLEGLAPYRRLQPAGINWGLQTWEPVVRCL